MIQIKVGEPFQSRVQKNITRWETHQIDLQRRNGSCVSITMAKYNFPGCTAINWELVGKDLGTCWPDSTKMAPHGPSWELVGKKFGTFQELSTPK